MQSGRICELNQQRGMFIVEVEDAGFVVFELLSGVGLAVGDTVKGNLCALGGEQLLHDESGESFSAYGQSGPSSLSACRARYSTPRD